MRHLSLLLIVSFGFSSFIQWEEEKQLTHWPEDWGVYSPKIVCSGDTVYIVFYTQIPDNYEVYFLSSFDAGLTWSDLMVISPYDTQGSILPYIAAVGCTVHVVWMDEGLTTYAGIPVYRRSRDGGRSWDSIIRLSPPPLGLYYGPPGEIAIGPGDTVITQAFLEKSYGPTWRYGSIRFSSDGGTTWSDTILGPTWLGQPSHCYLRYNSGRLHAVHIEYPGVWWEIGYNFTTDLGHNWSDTLLLSPYDSIHSFRPAFNSDRRSNLYAVWCDYKFSPYPWTGDIFFAKSTNNGDTWSDYQMLTNLHRAHGNEIFVVGDTVYVVYEDARDHTPHDTFEIYFRVSTDQGQTWFDEERLTILGDHSAYDPDIAVSKDWVYVVWADDRNLIRDLFFKRGYIGVG
ncbi:hypothetical protein DRP53_10890, partial [candidate division WOR-3 bacterium]